VNSKECLKTTHKFGIRVPRTVKEAYEVDKENDNNLWQDVIAKDMEVQELLSRSDIQGREFRQVIKKLNAI
jgi:hypothetical protein